MEIPVNSQKNRPLMRTVYSRRRKRLEMVLQSLSKIWIHGGICGAT